MRALIVIPEANLYSLHRVCRKAYADCLCDLPQEEVDRIEGSVFNQVDITVDRVSSGLYNYLFTPTDKFLWDNLISRSKRLIAREALQS